MTDASRRHFLKQAAAGAALAGLPASIARALAIPAARATGTIGDVRHIVILMQENRSFDHYFGTLRGVRGFGDRHPVPMSGGRTVWQQSDGKRELPPFHLDTRTTDALKVPGTPHSFSDAQAAWAQGKFGEWPRYKNPYSMGHYRREDIPFQFALAEAFTICDAYHCSVTSGTDPNRIVFWSGSSFDPEQRARGINCDDTNSEPNNLRCWIKGSLPDPGYTYAGNALTWPTIPDVLEAAGIDWRIYQDPNDNWTGAMHGGLAFESFRNAKPDSGLYRRGMSDWSLDQFAEDVRNGTLPQVSWILPRKESSEHPGASTPLEGAEFTAMVLDRLTANPEVWSRTAFFLTFDENDGQFDHVPPPSPPSYDRDGKLCGKSTVTIAGNYLHDAQAKYRDPTDTVSGDLRPWAMGPRVPMYVLSPWSKGGWVNSQVFDHTSVGQFIEKRFGVTIPAISPWHRAVSGDLTSAFDFAGSPDAAFPQLPDVAGASATVLAHLQRPRITPPDAPQPLAQEAGTRPSRALPYELAADARVDGAGSKVAIVFTNSGKAGAVFHVYDRLALDRIPRRYTVEAGKRSDDIWSLSDVGAYDLFVLGPAGFMRSFRGTASAKRAVPRLDTRVDRAQPALVLTVRGAGDGEIVVRDDVYRAAEEKRIDLARGGARTVSWPAAKSLGWYDVTVTGDGFEHRYAGRIETGLPSISDPALGDAGKDRA
jgi:phospholipase C